MIKSPGLRLFRARYALLCGLGQDLAHQAPEAFGLVGVGTDIRRNDDGKYIAYSPDGRPTPCHRVTVTEGGLNWDAAPRNTRSSTAAATGDRVRPSPPAASEQALPPRKSVFTARTLIGSSRVRTVSFSLR